MPQDMVKFYDISKSDGFMTPDEATGDAREQK